MFLTVLCLNASILVLKTAQEIEFRQLLSKKDVYSANVNNVQKSCSPITKEDILSGKYRSKGHFKKNRILCKKDVFIADKNRIIFNFGMIEIERDGKVLNQTDDYVRIKNTSGKIEKIYKDGRK